MDVKKVMDESESVIKEQLAKLEANEQSLYETDWFKERPPAVQDLIRAWPQWNFYQYKDSKAPVRIWGVMEMESKDANGNPELRFHACCAHLGWINETVGGIPPEAIEKVDRWTENQVTMIMTTPAPSTFLEPIGFVKFAMQANHENY